MDGGLRLRLSVIRLKHVFVIRVPDAAGCDVGEYIFAAKRRNGFSVIDETAADGVCGSGGPGANRKIAETTRQNQRFSGRLAESGVKGREGSALFVLGLRFLHRAD